MELLFQCCDRTFDTLVILLHAASAYHWLGVGRILDGRPTQGALFYALRTRRKGFTSCARPF